MPAWARTSSSGRRARTVWKNSPIPERFVLVPPGLDQRSSNVAQAYARYAADRAAGRSTDPDFETALGMHRAIDAIERSASNG